VRGTVAANDHLIVQHGEKLREPGDPGLTDEGRAQARRAAARVAGGDRVDELWSSTMRRAIETAAPIADALGLDVRTDERFRERMNWDGGDLGFADFLAEWARATSDRRYVPVTGDSSTTAAERFLAALDDRARTRPDGMIVVVAHGGVTVDVLRTIASDVALARDRPGLVDDGVPCGAVTRLRSDDGTWAVVHLPATDHLDDEVGHTPA
jgi:broad specificity phosphatase PhoE